MSVPSESDRSAAVGEGCRGQGIEPCPSFCVIYNPLAACRRGNENGIVTEKSAIAYDAYGD